MFIVMMWLTNKDYHMKQFKKESPCIGDTLRHFLFILLEIKNN